MQIIEPENIKTGEQYLLDLIQNELDAKFLEKLIKENYNVNNIICKGGDIIVYNNQVAYKLDLEIKLDFSIFMDRNGECITPIANSDKQQEENDKLNSENTLSEENIQYDLNNSDDHNPLDIEVDVQDELSIILQQNRKFWEQKKIESIENFSSKQ